MVKRFIFSFSWFWSTFVSWRLSHGLDFRCFCFSKDGDIRPVLWRYYLCFSSVMIFSSSVIIFEGLWLMIFISLGLTSESHDLSVLQTDWESEVLNVSQKFHISPSISSLLFFWVLLLSNLLTILFLEQLSVLRNSISLSSVAIILL